MTLRGLSDTQQAQTAAGYAATGAKIGSIVPGIGTVIGAVVGAVVGWLSAKKKPVRATNEQIQQCKVIVNEYMGYAAQLPSQPIPLDLKQLTDLNWCLAAFYGPAIGLRDPRWFNPGFTDGWVPIAKKIVRAIYETPVGATVNLASFTLRDPKGRTLTFKGFSFTNPVFTDLKSFADQYFSSAVISFCQNTAGKGSCPDYLNHPEWKRLMYDLLGWAARTELPNISESDLRAASQVAATVPGSSAKDVVNAVEQIMGRTVKSGETAAVLTPATGPPPVLPIVPTGPPTTAPPASGLAPVSVAQPGYPPPSTLPAPTPFEPFPTSASSTTPFTPFTPLPSSTSFAPSMPTGDIVPMRTPGVAPGMTEKSVFDSPIVIGGGLLALGALFMLTQRRKRA